MSGAPVTPPKTRLALVVASVAALALIGTLGWTAAEGGRGLDNADLRTVIVVTLAVFVAGYVASRRSA